jgi:hypothetical protein
MSGVIAPAGRLEGQMGSANRQRASLNARLVVLCETTAQLRAAVLVRSKVAENHSADATGEKQMEPATPPVARLPDTCGCSGSLNSRNSHHV